MVDLEQYIFTKISSKIFSIEQSEIDDIYVLSFYISNVDDDPRKPMIKFGYNTITQLRRETIKASDEREAKWNYAYWIQNSLEIIGDNYGENHHDNNKIIEWAKNLNIYYSDEFEKENFDEAMNLGAEIISQFVNVCIQVVKKLHANDVVRNKFGMDIPILIHELEYYDEIAHQNLKANPKELVKDFALWCVGK